MSIATPPVATCTNADLPFGLTSEAAKIYRSLNALHFLEPAQELEQLALLAETPEEAAKIRAIAKARLPKQARFVRDAVISGLCRRFSEETGYRVMGRKTEDFWKTNEHGTLVTINMEAKSRGIGAGPCVFSCLPIEEYEKQIPDSVLLLLAEVRGEQHDLFRNMLCLEPLVKNISKDGTITYFSSFQQIRLMARPRTIDPLVVGSLPGADDLFFCLAHWD
jgi:hypothetical protein